MGSTRGFQCNNECKKIASIPPLACEAHTSKFMREGVIYVSEKIYKPSVEHLDLSIRQSFYIDIACIMWLAPTRFGNRAHDDDQPRWCMQNRRDRMTMGGH
uniref:Uncharacterized protein n=1 Tax=Schistocephalus solidus TaxID=70667 RepID=A0A0X3P6I5_SCHSO